MEERRMELRETIIEMEGQKFVVKELTTEDMWNLGKSANFNASLIANSIKEPVFTEEEVKKLPHRLTKKVMEAINKMNEFGNFTAGQEKTSENGETSTPLQKGTDGQ
jgi:hypothetical protein